MSFAVCSEETIDGWSSHARRLVPVLFRVPEPAMAAAGRWGPPTYVGMTARPSYQVTFGLSYGTTLSLLAMGLESTEVGLGSGVTTLEGHRT